MAKAELMGRIRYVENYRDGREAYVFEIKWTNESESEWGLDKAFYIDDDRISYKALTQVREWQNIGIKKIIWQ